MNKLFSIALALLVSLSAVAAFAQSATGSATFTGGGQSESAGNAMFTNENVSVHGGGVGIGRATEECVTSRTYLNGVVASGTDCVFRPSTLKEDTTPCAKIVQVVRKGACTAAAEYLTFLQRGTGQYEPFTKYLRKELAVAGLTLEDFKMSEAKLRELQVVGAKKEASEYLARLRKGTTQYKPFEASLRKELQAFNLPLSAVGTSEDELAKLKAKGAKLSATEYLVRLRKGTSFYKDFMYALREELKAGGLTPADIGSSEFELADVRQSKN